MKIDYTKPVKVNFGSGTKYMEEWINIDYNPRIKTDILFDIRTLPEKKLPIKDNSVDEILAKHLVEHIPELIPFMNECWRILKPGGFLNIETPDIRSKGFHLDPTHIRGYLPDTFRLYFIANDGFKEFYNIDRWQGMEIRSEDTEQDGWPMIYMYIKLFKPDLKIHKFGPRDSKFYED